MRGLIHLQKRVRKKMMRHLMVEAILLSQSGWLDADFVELPPLTLKHIRQYFITGNCKKNVLLQQSPLRGGISCLMQRRCNAFHCIM